MTLLSGDLTTPVRVQNWMGSDVNASSAIVLQLISSMSAMIKGKLNRGAQLYSQSLSRIFNGVGNNQIILPNWPVTAVTQVQAGNVNIPSAPLSTINSSGTIVTQGPGYGFRFVSWGGELPGDPTVLEFLNGCFWPGVQNIKVTYVAGYLISNEAASVPGSGPYTITVSQPLGIWCRDNGISYASSGIALTPVSVLTGVAGQYLVGPDTTPGLYTFNAADANAALLISYSFIPADLEEATIQMVAERYSYRSRIGVESKSLGGQETMRFMRGGRGFQQFPDLPPEVEALIWPYVSTILPSIGASL